jgi:hypothetical protein
MNYEFPETQDFFGSYFHQDWTVEHDTPDQVIADFLQTSDAETLLSINKELRALLKQNKEELVLREYLLKELSCYYCYWNEWESGRAWLMHVQATLHGGLEK